MVVLLRCIVSKAVFLLVLLLPCGTSVQRYLCHTKGVGELQDTFSVLCGQERDVRVSSALCRDERRVFE